MKIKIAAVAAVLLLGLTASAAMPLVPVPVKVVEQRDSFTINDKTAIAVSRDGEESKDAVAFLTELIANSTCYKLQTTNSFGRKNCISCRHSAEMADDGSYRLKVAKNGVTVYAGGSRGFFYAFQTLRQLMPAEIEKAGGMKDKSFKIACCTIEDRPSFPYRGVMLDVSRHFLSKNEVMRQIDLMSMLKLNKLHFHLVDDQGWRLEIKKYPKLTSVGGYRKMTVSGRMWDPDRGWDTTRYGGYYTQEDIKEIVDYARSRFVEIIPEIEMPGHALAALAAYPEYSCTGGPFNVEGTWGVFNDVMCTKEKTFEFVENILAEVMTLFPSRYIHLGGDESPRIRWKNCVHCQKRIAEEGLENEAQLQTYFMNRIESYLSQHGKSIIGWDEILEGGIPQRATIMSWRGEKGGIEAAKAGYDVVMSPNSHMYFNCVQEKKQPFDIGNNRRVITLEKAYSYNPVPEVLTIQQAKHVLGVQANLWTEYINGETQTDYMLYPRLAAMAETAWSPKEKKDYGSFLKRFENIAKHYDALGVNYYKPQN